MAVGTAARKLLEPSALGTKDYWDKAYARELHNHEADAADHGTVWFSESNAEAAILAQLDRLASEHLLARAGENASRFVDLGTGNGHLLFALRGADSDSDPEPDDDDDDDDVDEDSHESWQGAMVGVDYSATSIQLAQRIAAQHPATADVRFAEWDLLGGSPGPWLPLDGFDVALDKGTFDAISLMAAPTTEDAGGGGTPHPCETYRANVLPLIKPGGFLVLTSCNWTKEELLEWMIPDAEGELGFHGEAAYPTFTFGGRKGHFISSWAMYRFFILVYLRNMRCFILIANDCQRRALKLGISICRGSLNLQDKNSSRLHLERLALILYNCCPRNDLPPFSPSPVLIHTIADVARPLLAISRTIEGFRQAVRYRWPDLVCAFPMDPMKPIDADRQLAITPQPGHGSGSRDREKFAQGNDELDPNLVAFVQPFDASNPVHWSRRRKWIVTGVMSATAFVRITSSTIMAPALGPISQDLHMSSIEAQMALSVYLLASAFGPLVLSPLSELYGRKPVLHASNLWFLAWNLACGFADSKGLLIAARCFSGFGGSVAYAQLALPLAVTSLNMLPGIGGYSCLAQTEYFADLDHRVFWCLSAAQALLVLVSFVMFQESHAPTILHQRAKHFRKTTGNAALFTIQERLDAGLSVGHVLLHTLSRPLRLLAFHPIIQFISLLQAVSYGFLYLALSTYATLWTDNYGESIATSGLHYFAIALGEITGTQIGGAAMDFLFRRMKARRNGVVSPENRVPLMLPGLILAPVGLLIYGWTAHFHAPWPAVDAGMLVFTWGLQMQGQPLAAYIIDAYPDHTSSATAAAQLLRSLAAFGFPLFAPTLYKTLGYGWGNSTLAFASLLLFSPAPILLCHVDVSRLCGDLILDVTMQREGKPTADEGEVKLTSASFRALIDLFQPYNLANFRKWGANAVRISPEMCKKIVAVRNPEGAASLSLV
nr:putative efflux pump mfs2 [Quercus suber]